MALLENEHCPDLMAGPVSHLTALLPTEHANSSTVSPTVPTPLPPLFLDHSEEI